MPGLILAVAIAVLVGGCATPQPPSTAASAAGGPTPSTPSGGSADPAPSAPPDIDDVPIALVSDAEGGAAIYLAGPDGARRRLSPPGPPAVTDFAPVWAPAGDRIAHHRIEADGISAIYVADPVTGDQRRLALVGPASTSDPRVSWSPDGSRLAFWSTGGADNEIQIVDVADGALSTPSADPAADRYPAWSPAGDVLAFWSDRSGRGAIWLVAPDGTGLRQLVEVGATRGPVAWSPDGQRLAIPVERPGQEWLIRIVNLDGTGEVELAPDGSALGPGWSPDGASLAYVQIVGSARQLWIADTSDGDVTPIGPPAATSDASLASHVGDRWPSPPSWSPDGASIVVEWPDADGVEVIVVGVDDGTWVSLTPSEANEGTPMWRPASAP